VRTSPPTKDAAFSEDYAAATAASAATTRTSHHGRIYSIRRVRVRHNSPPYQMIRTLDPSKQLGSVRRTSGFLVHAQLLPTDPPGTRL
jgi:hypothetical protein